MSFLSQVHVDRSEAAALGLVDSYAWHRRLWRAFAHPDPRAQERPFLFRVDPRAQGETFRVLLLSDRPPADPGWPWETRAVAPSFLGHCRYRFQVRANPTVKRVVRDQATGLRRKNGRRLGLFDDEGLRRWIGRKAAQAGFLLLSCRPGPALTSPFVKEGVRGEHLAVDFAGLLEVVDQAAFEQAFRRGLGPAKAFGFGLLLLQPLGPRTGRLEEEGVEGAKEVEWT